jgi:selenide, water dikinase
MSRIVPASEVVLVGGGHSHLEVIRRFGAQENPLFRLTLINSQAMTPYSGILPNLIAGHCTYDDAHIDLGHLCVAHGVRFVKSYVDCVDPSKRTVKVASDRMPIPFDTLSFDIGVNPKPLSSDFLSHVTSDRLIQIQPVHRFLESIETLEHEVSERQNPLGIIIYGVDLAACELAMALSFRFRQSSRTLGRIHITMIHDREILENYPQKMREKVLAQLKRFRIDLIVSSQTKIDDRQLKIDHGPAIEWDKMILGCPTLGPDFLLSTGLELDDQHRIRVNDNLESTSHDGIYAAGDIASLNHHTSLSRSGVYLKGLGNVLAENLLRRFSGLQQIRFKPGRRSINFVSLGEKSAICAYGGFSIRVNRLWELKNSWDLSFIEKYQMKPITARVPTFIESGNLSVAPCSASGAKLPYDVLKAMPVSFSQNKQVREFNPENADTSLIDLPDEQLVQSADFLRAFTDNLFLFGRIASCHGLNHIYARGLLPHSAFALATVAFGPKLAMTNDFRTLMEGCLATLNASGCSLAGVRSQAGREAGFGLLAQGIVKNQRPSLLWDHSSAEEGDLLLLTKPLGSGVLLSAYPTFQTSTDHLLTACTTMAQHQNDVVIAGKKFGVRAATGIAEFGMAWHLAQLVRAKSLMAQVSLDSMPFYSGALKAVASGIRASLHVQNRMPFNRSLQGLNNRQLAMAELFFDPQTSSGILLCVNEKKGEPLKDALIELGFPHTSIVGEIKANPTDSPEICFI